MFSVMATGNNRTPKPARPDWLVLTPSLSPDDYTTLQLMTEDASHLLGRKVNHAAVLGALLRYARQQGRAWRKEQLFPLLEDE